MENNNRTEQDDNSSKDMARPSSDSAEGEQIQLQQQQIVPVLEEDYSISKETSIKEAKIEKRLVTKTKTVKVPIVYEELYVNGKKLKSVEESQILSALKDKITSLAGRGNADTSAEQSVRKKNKIENRGELVPLLSSSTAVDDGEEADSEAQREKEIEIEKVIPLYEEQFEIIKKMVKVADIVITKRRITEKKKIDIDVRTEEVTVKYPDGSSEKLS
jgi:stress response protein YsnF